jgi:hypothetical protein
MAIQGTTSSARVRPTGTDGNLGAYAAVVLLASATAHALIGTATSLYPAVQDPHRSLWLWSGAVLTAGHLGVLFAVATMIATGVAGRGWLARVGFVIALAGLTLLSAAEALIRVNFSAGNSVFGIASPLTALGMILLGVAVVRARAWRGWHRFTPLACGLYIPVVLLPSFAIAKGPSFIALTGWSLCFVAFGVAMYRERHTEA